ncbi:MAG TPA: hypothetical protein VN316_01845 [candidate division Zixibacteria bacterium]|nr:hypothetical protein [candidate division Zixibacteria bacterium]
MNLRLSDRTLYDKEKQKVAEIVIGILDNYFHGIKNQVEVIDVPTLMTWERYMGGTHGFANMPSKKSKIIASLLGRGQERNLPGLSNFHFMGAWATSTGALFSNAHSQFSVYPKSRCPAFRPSPVNFEGALLLNIAP